MTTPSDKIPATEYVVVNRQPAGRTGGSSSTSQNSAATSTATRERQRVSIPSGLPGFLGNRQTIFAAWIVAMIVVGFDDWHNYHILPRPARLWYTSLTYGLLILASMADALVPLANALAIGYAIMLIWQYYNGTGQFAQGSQ